MTLFLCVFAVYGATAAREHTSIDAHAAAVESWHIASAGEPWLEGVMTPKLSKDPWLAEAPNGHVVSHRMAGPILLGIPFYFVAEHVFGVRAFSLLPGSVAAAACTAGAVLLMFLALRRRVPDSAALIGALAFAIATPTWSISADMLWTHTITQFGLAGAAYAASRSRWWMAGLFLGIGMLGRPHVAVIAAVLGLGLTWSRRSWAPALRIAVPTVAALGVLLLWNRWVFGAFSIGGAYQGRVSAAVSGFGGDSMQGGAHAQLVNYLGFLVAPDRGFLVWTPIALLLLPTVIRTWSGTPDWARWLFAGGVIYSFFQLRLNNFTGGDAFFGYRLGLELLTCVAPVYVLAATRAGPAMKRMLPALVGLQAGAIGWGAVTEGSLLPYEDVWHDNSLWWALRHYPVIVGSWLLVWIIAVLLVQFRLAARTELLPAVSVPSSIEA